jgi:hypothetical protein
MATTKKNPIIGPATRAKVTSVVRKVQNSKAAGAVKKAGVQIKQEARVIGRAVERRMEKKEKTAAAPASPASEFQATSKVFGSGKIKSPSELKAEKKQERVEKREFRKSGRMADRAKRLGDGERAFTLSPGSERFQSSNQGRAKKKGPTLYKDGQAYELSTNKRKAVREIVSLRTDRGAELSTPKELRRAARKTLEIITSKPTTDAEKRKRDNKLQRGKRAATTGGGTNACREDVMGTTGGKKGTNCKPKK